MREYGAHTHYAPQLLKEHTEEFAAQMAPGLCWCASRVDARKKREKILTQPTGAVLGC